MNKDISQLIAAKQFASGTLTDGNAVVLMIPDPPPGWMAVWVLPMAGMSDGITVFYSQDGGTTYTPWPMGEAKAPIADVIVATATHLKFQRTSGSGHQSRWGVVTNSLVADVIAGPWLSQGTY